MVRKSHGLLMMRKSCLVEEERALGGPFVGIVGFPVDIGLDVRNWGEWTLFCELGGLFCFILGFGIDLLEDILVGDAFLKQVCHVEVDGILGFLVLLYVLLGPVGIIGIGDGMATVAVGHDF